MPKAIVFSNQAPAALGAYSQAVRAGDFLFLSGQIPIDPANSQLVPGGIEEQTRRVLENLRAVLAAANAGFEHVVKVSVFLVDMQEFAAFNAVYVTYFDREPPARATVAVSALPRGARIEIEAVAYLGA